MQVYKIRKQGKRLTLWQDRVNFHAIEKFFNEGNPPQPDDFYKICVVEVDEDFFNGLKEYKPTDKPE